MLECSCGLDGKKIVPNHQQKVQVFKLLDATACTGIELTESTMMIPMSSVCGFYFGNKEARYVDVR